MTTKESLLPNLGKQGTFVGLLAKDSYNSINLNQNHNFQYVPITSISNDFKKHRNNGSKISQPRNKSYPDNFRLRSQSWGSKRESDENEKVSISNKISSKKTSSTLSLHIAAYENAIEASKDLEIVEKVAKDKVIEPVYPRQNFENCEPEIAPFKTSQKLMVFQRTSAKKSPVVWQHNRTFESLVEPYLLFCGNDPMEAIRYLITNFTADELENILQAFIELDYFQSADIRAWIQKVMGGTFSMNFGEILSQMQLLDKSFEGLNWFKQVKQISAASKEGSIAANNESMPANGSSNKSNAGKSWSPKGGGGGHISSGQQQHLKSDRRGDGSSSEEEDDDRKKGGRKPVIKSDAESSSSSSSSDDDNEKKQGKKKAKYRKAKSKLFHRRRLPGGSGSSISRSKAALVQQVETMVAGSEHWTRPKQKKLLDSLSQTSYKANENPIYALLSDLSHKTCQLNEEEVRNLEEALSKKSTSSKTSGITSEMAVIKEAPAVAPRFGTNHIPPGFEAPNDLALPYLTTCSTASKQPSSSISTVVNTTSIATTRSRDGRFAKRTEDTPQALEAPNILEPSNLSTACKQSSSSNSTLVNRTSIATTRTSDGRFAKVHESGTIVENLDDTLRRVEALTVHDPAGYLSETIRDFLRQEAYGVEEAKDTKLVGGTILREHEFIQKLIDTCKSFIMQRERLNSQCSGYIFQQSLKELLIFGENLNLSKPDIQGDALSEIEFDKIYQQLYNGLMLINQALDSIFLLRDTKFKGVPEPFVGSVPPELNREDTEKLKNNPDLLQKLTDFHHLMKKIYNSSIYINARRELLYRKLAMLLADQKEITPFRRRLLDKLTVDLKNILLVNGEIVEIATYENGLDIESFEECFGSMREECDLLLIDAATIRQLMLDLNDEHRIQKITAAIHSRFLTEPDTEAH